MKKQLLALCALIAIANGINAMESLEKTQVASRKAAIKLQNPSLSDKEISGRLLIKLVETGSENDLPAIIWLLEEGKIDTSILAQALKKTFGRSPAIQVALYKAYIKQLTPGFSEEARSETLLRELVACECKEALELLLKQGVRDVTGAALETAISLNFYSGTELLLLYNSPITERAWKLANDWATNRQDDRYLKLLQKNEPMREEQMQIEHKRLLSTPQIQKILEEKQLPFERQ